MILPEGFESKNCNGARVIFSSILLCKFLEIKRPSMYIKKDDRVPNARIAKIISPNIK